MATNGTLEPVVEAVRQPRRSFSSFKRGYNCRLSFAILRTRLRLDRLAGCGRPGQWILHHEDLYLPRLDTRPQSRNPDTDVPVRGLTYRGVPISDEGLVWAGTGPVPDFHDVAFWEGKIQDLDTQIERVKARLVQPRFTPEELRTLAALEAQPGHSFCANLKTRQQYMNNYKKDVANILFSLARLGRPGQWILHNEELYHPAIDTRPQARAAARQHMAVRDDSCFKGDIRRAADGLFVEFALAWAGDGPVPDFDDILYWKDTRADLMAKREQVQEGQVQPGFTAAELRVLEAMEADDQHAFALIREARRYAPPPSPPPDLTPATMRLRQARELAVVKMRSLWDDGLAGQWVLHGEALFFPEHDIRQRTRCTGADADVAEAVDGDVDEAGTVLVERYHGLRFDTLLGQPRPDFGSAAYWEAKYAELREKHEAIKAGKLTEHHFTAGERMRIVLLERAIEEAFDSGGETVVEDDDGNGGGSSVAKGEKGGKSSVPKGEKGIAAWIDRSTRAAAEEDGNGDESQPSLADADNESQPRPATADDENRPRPATADDQSQPSSANADDETQPRPATAAKRKRPAGADEAPEQPPSAKRSKGQQPPPPEPSATTG